MKNRKIKEMEDLLEIKSKKEESMKDLEILKSEITKNKGYMESLKKINLIKQTQGSSQSFVDKKDPRTLEMKNISPIASVNASPSPVPVHKPSHSPNLTNKHLPDLVNHEKIPRKSVNSESQFGIENLQYLNLSKQYLNHLKEIQDQSHQGIQSKDIAFPFLKTPINNTQYSEAISHLINSTSDQSNSRPQSSIQNRSQQGSFQVTDLQTNDDKNGKDISQAQLHNGNTINHPRPHPIKCQSVSLTKVPTANATSEIEARRKQIESKTKNDEFLRPREFSREAHLQSSNDVSSFMNNFNNLTQTKNFMENRSKWSQFVQTNLERQTNFPDSYNAMAFSSDRRVLHPHMRTPTPTTSNQRRDSANLLSKCAVCTKVANFLCSGCQKVYYCTVQCQVKFSNKTCNFHIFSRAITG